MSKQKKQPAQGMTVGRVLKVFFGTLGRLIATMMMVGIITGCIVASVLTVYILNMVGADDEIDLDTLRLGYTSIIYAYDENGREYELQQLYFSDSNRIWVNYDEISDYVKEAAIAIEDKRFKEHDGVDWRRTFGAFLNMFVPGTSEGGGSTITQQLIKNVTNDDDIRVDRKVREIFRALNLEKRYTKNRIMESYLNVVSFGGGTNGIESAAQRYFGKSAGDLTLAESAAIVGITKYPGLYNPFRYPENNKDRQEYILEQMLEQGKITQQEHDDAVAQTLVFKQEEYQQSVESVQNYFVDQVIEDVISDLMEQKGYTYSGAETALYNDGYRIYTTVDMDMQNYLEELYRTMEGFPQVNNEEYPQSCAIIIDPNGKILALVGGTGEKTADRLFNRATMATRHPGSSLKPIGPYAVAFEYDRVRWSTLVEDGPINLASEGLAEQSWPVNFDGLYRGNVTVAYAIQQSVNTVPAKLVQAMTPQTVFDFLKNQLNFHSLVDRVVIDGQVFSDISLAPMTLGALTYGVTPMEMVGGYQIYNNGGHFTTPYTYYKVEDADGRIILNKDTTPRRVISEDTSVVMNKALQLVTTYGTGTRASLGPAMPTAGKTGTSDDDVNQWFIGMTPYYVCAVWMGYDEELRVNQYGNWVPNSIGYRGLTYPPPALWKTIMEPLHEDLDTISFYDSEDVVSKSYCTVTGNLATSACTSVATGWYKKDSLPPNCSGNHVTSNSARGNGDDDDDSSGSSPSSSTSGSSSGSGQQDNNPPRTNTPSDDNPGVD